MRSRRVTLLLTLLALALVLLAGCGPRAGAGAQAAAAAPGDIVIDLPALYIDIAEDGSASVGGIPLADLGVALNQDLSAVALPAATVAMLTGANIQHIQLDNTPAGLAILVNGTPVPTLVWDDESLATTAATVDMLGAGAGMLGKLLPLVTQLGTGVVVRLPVAAGAEPVPFAAAESDTAAAAKAAQEAFLSAVQTPPTVQVAVDYAEDGTWSVAGMSEAEWTEIVPQMAGLATLGDLVVKGSAAGIDDLTVNTNADGVFILLNGKPLPYLTWADGRIENVLDLAAQAGLLQQALGPDADVDAALNVIKSLLPALQTSNVSLNVNFP